MASAGSCPVMPVVAEDQAHMFWYAAYTKHQHERHVARQFASKGLESLLPLCQKVHRWQDRAKDVHLPLFPCYVFVRMNLQRRLDALMARGVFWLVGSGGVASPIPDLEMEQLRTLAASSARVEPHPYLTQGDRVRVRSGPLVGIEGIFVRSRGQCRVILSVPLLMQAAAVEVEVSLLERIPPRRSSASLPSEERQRGEESRGSARNDLE
jgi:transcription antitermination factor NusG